MVLNQTISKLREQSNLSQEQFAALVGVSRQSVQKWESGSAVPELEKLIRIAKYFDISLDALVLDSNIRITEELHTGRELKPVYANLHESEDYAANLATEYQQSVEEGLDLEVYEPVFAAVARLPRNEIKKKFSDVLFEAVLQAKVKKGYPYLEPSELEAIRQLRKPGPALPAVDRGRLEQKIRGAWMGRICGCFLGKPVEGIHTDELIPFLKETNNYPMHRYVRSTDVTEETLKKYQYRFWCHCYADTANGMPVDDDMNYVVLAQEVIETHGRAFTARDVSQAWMSLQPKTSYFTAERVAFCNLINGYEPPDTALYKNPYREWIGAQIRGDYYGWINPGDPETAAEMAFRDASVSHVKNGIYGEMFVSAMLAAAACTADLKTVLQSGLAQIPATSRLYEAIQIVISGYESGVSEKACFADIHRRYDERTDHGLVHTISNAMVVAAALLYGGGDYSRSICMAVENGYDTDCNGATVGSIIGMAKGIECVDSRWMEPIGDTLHTSILGLGTVSISDRIRQTMAHIAK